MPKGLLVHKAIFGEIGSAVGQDILTPLLPLYPLSVIVVPVIVLIVGYVHVFSGLLLGEVPKKTKKQKEDIRLEDFVKELRGAAYRVVDTLRLKLDPKKTKKKGG